MKIKLHHIMRRAGDSPPCRSQSAIALIMVLLMIVFLGGLAILFANTILVETKLARNATFDAEIEWVGRSGIEMCRWLLAQEAMGPAMGPGMGPAGTFYCLQMQSAGGPGMDSNSPVIPKEIPLSDTCSFTWQVEDCDRKININRVSPDLFKQILTHSIGVEEELAETIAASLQDWRDEDDNRTPNGAETEDYATNPNPGYPPYRAKNEDIHDISELLMLHGVTPAIYGSNRKPPRLKGASGFGGLAYAVTLNKLFTAVSGGKVNINTASRETLEAILQDPNMVQVCILSNKANTPLNAFFNIGQVGCGLGATPLFRDNFDVTSQFFEATIDARAGDRKRRYVGLLRRSGRDVRLMGMYWKENDQ